MRIFGAGSLRQFNNRLMSVTGLSSLQDSSITEAFDTFDIDGSGTLQIHEFQVALKALGFEMSKLRAKKWLEKYECAEKGLDLDTFKQICASYFKHQDPIEKAKIVFRLLDKDDSNSIGFNDLMDSYLEVGVCKSKSEVQRLINEFDFDQDGELSFEEFLGINNAN